MKTIALKKIVRHNVAVHPFLTFTPPPTRAWGTLLAPAQFHNRSLADPHTWQAPAKKTALLEESTRIGLDPPEWKGECPENGALEPSSHGTFLHVAQQTRRQPSQFHYISRDHPNAHELTNYIRHPSPEPILRSPGPWKVVVQVVWDCPRHQLVQPAVSPGYSESVLRTESDFCCRARIQLANQLIPTNLNKCNNLKNYNKLHNDNNDNNFNKTDTKTIITIITIISIITILRIVICFQRRHESTVKRFGPGDTDGPVSVCAEAEKRSKTRAYQTESGVTTKAPFSIPGGRINEVQSVTKVVSQGTGCSKPAAHHCTWCGQAPNSCIVRSGPCAERSFSIPMSQAVQLPAK
jgi:hypothetical protein